MHDVRLKIQPASTADCAEQLDHASLTRPLFFNCPAKKISGLARETTHVQGVRVQLCSRWGKKGVGRWGEGKLF